MNMILIKARKFRRIRRMTRLRAKRRIFLQGKGTTGTIPEPMMWGVARKYQLACLATDSGVYW
jgi:hypothetical protein